MDLNAYFLKNNANCISKLVKWCKMSHNYKSIQCNMYGFIDSTFRPEGGPSSGMFLIQFCYDKVHDCVIILQGLFTFVVIVTV